MKTLLISLAAAIYFIIGFIQLAAIMSGMEYWLGFELHWAVWIFAFPFLVAVAELPIIGTVAGIMGAVHGWHWTYASAVTLFCWPYALYLVLAFLAWASEVIQLRRRGVAPKN